MRLWAAWGWLAPYPSRPVSAEPRSVAAGPGGGAEAGAGAGSAVRVKLPALAPDPGAPNAELAEPLLLKEEPADSAAPLPRLFRFSSRPAAMTVTRTSSPRASSMTAPKMMFASTAAELETS